MRRLIDRLLVRFGYVRVLPTELIVFSSMDKARAAGFCGDQHPRLPLVRAWWPGQGARGLRVRPVQRVTFSAEMRWHRTSEGALLPLLRARQTAFGDDAVWIEL